MTPVVDLRHCDYDKHRGDKGRGVLKLASEFVGMPRALAIKSHHTNKIVCFVPVGQDDVMFDEDGWDGEQQIYRPVGDVPGVDYLVIYNQY